MCVCVCVCLNIDGVSGSAVPDSAILHPALVGSRCKQGHMISSTQNDLELLKHVLHQKPDDERTRVLRFFKGSLKVL